MQIKLVFLSCTLCREFVMAIQISFDLLSSGVDITKNLLIILSLHNYQAQKLCAGILCHIVPVRSTLSPSLINVKSLQFLRNLTRFITIIKTEDIFGSKILPFPVRSTDQCALTHGVEYSNNHIAKIYLNHRRLRIFPILSLPH